LPAGQTRRTRTEGAVRNLSGHRCAGVLADRGSVADLVSNDNAGGCSMRLTIALGVLLLIGACRGDAPQQLAEGAALDSLVLELMPTVAEVTGLEFRDVPRAALRSRE